MPSMREQYMAVLRDRDPSTIDTLYLDNSDNGNISGIDDKLTNLEMLSMVKCGLTTLTGLPKLPSLISLDLSDNLLGDEVSFDVLVRNTPDLKKIILANNKLSLENLRTLKMLKNINEIDLSGNEDLITLDNYRASVFEMIPHLNILDGCNVDGEEIEEEYAAEGEGAEDSEDGSVDEDGPGLSYLNKSQFSDDETDDYIPEEICSKAPRGFKRAACRDVSDEPEPKKSAAEEDDDDDDDEE